MTRPSRHLRRGRDRAQRPASRLPGITFTWRESPANAEQWARDFGPVSSEDRARQNELARRATALHAHSRRARLNDRTHLAREVRRLRQLATDQGTSADLRSALLAMAKSASEALAQLVGRLPELPDLASLLQRVRALQTISHVWEQPQRLRDLITRRPNPGRAPPAVVMHAAA